MSSFSSWNRGDPSRRPGRREPVGLSGGVAAGQSRRFLSRRSRPSLAGALTELTVIVPAFDERPAIEAGKLATVSAWLSGQGRRGEILVVDDGSSDGTCHAAEPYADRVIRIPHGGKAAALVTGIQQARGDVLVFADMDQAAPISQASRLLAALHGGADVAIGSRGLRREDAPLGRYVLSWGQAGLRSLLLRLPLTDTQCGLKAVRRHAATDIVRHLRRYHPSRLGPRRGPSVTSGFDVEFLLVARRRGYRVAEVPVTWSYHQTRQVRLIRDAWRGTLDLLSILQHDLRGRYRT